MGMFNPDHEEEAFFGGLYVKDFEAKAKRALHDTFGYVPDEANGERYAVYAGGIEPTLIVIHATRKPRLYKSRCGGRYYELDPYFST